MNEANLKTYLNDHLAGSVAAIELLKKNLDKNKKDSLSAFLRKFLKEISEEQDLLKALLHILNSSESSVKKAGAWFFEKLSRLKLNFSNQDEPLASFTELEGLFVGVNGKLNLWKVMAECFSQDRRFKAFDFESLWQRSIRQREEMQKFALLQAHKAFK